MNKVRKPQPSIALIVSISILVTSLIHLSESQLIVNNNDGRSDLVMRNYYVDEPYVRPVFADIVGGDRHIYSYIFNSSLLEQWPAVHLQFYAETEKVQGSEANETNDPLLVTATWLQYARGKFLFTF
ncbi:unnamed protein product [Orchesella dallaii]|uniref:Uncharacterized protein n=1 Tax=Orchesella dallaii TaxID=48710 RepID=A0ABP1QSG3_9HEXA